MKKVLVIVTKNGFKYQIGIDKSVVEVLNEIAACKGEFYNVHKDCAIRVSEISSVEQFEYDPEEGEGNDD